MMVRLKTAAIAATLVIVAVAPSRADDTLKETGSTLILPLFQVWARDYAETHQGVSITTAGTGSGKGIDAAIDGSATIGTSDAFMTNEQVDQHPGMLNIAMAISAQTVNYDLPGLARPLKLDGPVLVGIYSGKIRSWNDQAIAALNPGLSLPDRAIIPVRRADASGDTFVFTQYLSFTTSSQEIAGFFAPTSSWEPGYGTSITWPDVQGARTATGNQGMVDVLETTPYSIGYVGVSFEQEVDAAKLGTAEMKSYSGQFLTPTPETIAAAASSLTPRTPDDERLTLVNAPGENCYPLINYEYAIVRKQQPDPKIAAVLRRFLLWATAPDEDNAKALAATHFIPLPAHVWVKSYDQIEAIH